MKKIICLILLTSLVLSTFIGCDPTSSNSSTKSLSTTISDNSIQLKESGSSSSTPDTTKTQITTNPSTLAPTTNAPTTNAPTTNAPTTKAPITNAPTTKAPTTAPNIVVPTNPISQTVYITNTGEKYHSSGCRYLSKSKIPISLSDAKARGYTPCSVCNPPR